MSDVEITNENTSNTGENRQKQTNKGQFVKGDLRINRKGAPNTSKKLRELYQSIGAEPAMVGQKLVEDDDYYAFIGGKPIIHNGKMMTVTEYIGRSLAYSKDSKERKLFIAYGWGNPVDTTEITGKDGSDVELIVKYENKRNPTEST